MTEQGIINQAIAIIEPIAHKTSPSYARLEKMGFDRPAPADEIQKAADAVSSLMGDDLKKNALLLLAATESQYGAGVTLKVFDYINNNGDNKERMAEIEDAEPGIWRAFKFGSADNQAMAEITKLSQGDIKNLDSDERGHFLDMAKQNKGVSPEQIKLVDEAIHQGATQNLFQQLQREAGAAL